MLMVTPPSSPRAMPAFVRAEGGVRVVFGSTRRGTVPLTIAESGGYRVRFLHTGEGVLINTGGGMTGGDRMRVEVAAQRGTDASMTTQAAEKIYRSDGEETAIDLRLRLEAGARLAWLPQEQILFDGARFRRCLDAAIDPAAELTLVESTVFGRLAMGETIRSGAFRDRWRIRRGGRLLFAEDVRLDGDVTSTLARRAVGAGARALATFLHIAPEAESRLDEARAHLAGSASECGASAFEGMLLVRFLSPDPQALRADLARFVTLFRGAAMPRSWQT